MRKDKFQRLFKQEWEHYSTHHQTETFEVAKGSCDHARDARDGFKNQNSLDERARVTVQISFWMGQDE